MKHSIVLKFLAILLCAAFLLVAVGAALGIGVLAAMGLYEKSVSEYRQQEQIQRAYNIADTLTAAYASRALGGCPEDLAESYYGLLYGNNFVNKNMVDYEILSLEGELLERSGPEASSDWIEVEWVNRYLVFLGDVPEETTAEETVPPTPQSEGAPEYDVTEPVLNHEEGFIYGYYDYETETHREVRLRHETSPGYTVRLLLTDQTGEAEKGWALLELLWQYRMDLFWILGAGVLLFVVLLVYLCCAAGHKRGTTEIRAGGLNRMPLELYGGIAAFGCFMAAFAIVEGGEALSRQNIPATVAFCAACGYGAAVLIVGFLFAFAAQVKTPGGFWWRNSLCGWACRLIVVLWNFFLKVLAWCWERFVRLVKWAIPLVKRCFVALWKVIRFFWNEGVKLLKKLWGYFTRFCRWLGKGASRFVSLLPLTWQWLLAAFLIIFILALTVNSYRAGRVVLGIALTLGIFLYASSCFGILLESAKRMRRGDLDTKVEDKFLIGCFREFSQELNGLADVAVVAAQKQLRSERMKTELITNVSHDIKTPLTSIINYVDLLEKPHTEEEQEQYLEVLHRQSQRLKKLIDDLMEMSKASSGNMTVEIGTVDAAEAVNQALGEFADKLDKVPLYPVFRQPEKPAMMLADGRLVWRVLSNVLSNACKYALPGTRLYVDVAEAEGDVIISLKNISREELNVEADELMERFVRGDASRNTEGSGLGLNIARSLMELQKGQLRLLVDGDLFKVTLIFPGAK